ncbi:unnamed protein product [Staurois parvus]|uniref:Uncharacterized protein n=1 Tax=Staurois parvus TaxID=386267 RepID=A0ABN9DB47_9NEOB|nr:unnamed protein product [Staurois parvus]
MSARSCDQLCPITADHMGHIHRSSEPQQCHLSESISASCRCSSMPPASANQCYIRATFQCPSVPHKCHISVPI